MPRKKRVWFPGAMYHITARGNRKEPIFREKDDYQYYLHLLKKAKQHYPLKLHSYCLMSNHIHLLIETQEHSPSQIIHYTHSLYARYFNSKYKCVGHLFQNRFDDKIIRDIKQLVDTSRYIHLNPVKAGLVKMPENYPWSSYKSFVTSAHDPLIENKAILESFGRGSKSSYRHYVELNMKKGTLYS